MGALDQLPERAGWRGWKLELSRDSSSGGTLQASSTMAQTRRGQRCRDIARFRRAGSFALPMRELAAIYHLPFVIYHAGEARTANCCLRYSDGDTPVYRLKSRLKKNGSL
jgi:hypothetical protein